MNEQATIEATIEVTAADILRAVTAAAELLRIRQGQGRHLTEEETLALQHQAAIIRRLALEMQDE